MLKTQRTSCDKRTQHCEAPFLSCCLCTVVATAMTNKKKKQSAQRPSDCDRQTAAQQPLPQPMLDMLGTLLQMISD